MNKYQDALEELAESSRKYVEILLDFNEPKKIREKVESSIRTLQELVDKETPKKIQYNLEQKPYMRKKYGNKSRYDGICPNCHKSLFPHFLFCPNCGQALDWSEKQ